MPVFYDLALAQQLSLRVLYSAQVVFWEYLGLAHRISSGISVRNHMTFESGISSVYKENFSFSASVYAQNSTDIASPPQNPLVLLNSICSPLPIFNKQSKVFYEK